LETTIVAALSIPVTAFIVAINIYSLRHPFSLQEEEQLEKDARDFQM
jgi:hypothetical protein